MPDSRLFTAPKELLFQITADANLTAHQHRWMLFQKWSTRSALRSKSTLTEESDEVGTSSWLSPSEPGQSESVAPFSGPSQPEGRQGSQGCFLYSRQISRRSWPSQVDELYPK